ncbi:MAG: hypothetical protein QM778_01750 [Myxococcales bacterium]
MNVEGPDPGMRESQLLRALAEQTAPRPVSWLMVVALVVVGSAAILLLVGSLGPLRHKPRLTLEPPVDPQLLKAAVSAYERADWDSAERYFRTIHERYPANARSQDYLDRIELTRRDAELLARAEESLVAGQPERARILSERVSPNSRLFAQAEGVTRSALAHGSSAEPPRQDGVAVDVKAALGEALSRYEDGKFQEAVSRAQGLAQRATGVAQLELQRWASDAREFGGIQPVVSSLSAGTDDAAVLGALSVFQRAIELDERCSEGHYARALRARAAKALLARAATLGQGGRLVDACADLVKARFFAGRALTFAEGGNPAMERRCESEAARRVNQARALERRRVPSKGGEPAPRDPSAVALYEQARALSLPGSPAHLAADQALAR